MRIENTILTRILGMNCGVYKIHNKVTGKCYIGSSLNIDGRLKEHKRELSKNIHSNKKLQNAYNEFGKDNFTFEILETCSKQDLWTIEKGWIDYFNSFNNGYNRTDQVFDSERKSRSKCFHFICPDGVVYQGKNLRAFSEQKGLNRDMMKHVRNGRLKHYKGWRNFSIDIVGTKYKEPSPQFSFDFLSPDGKHIHCHNLTELARKHNLHVPCLSSIIKGRIYTHRGWRKFSKDKVGVHVLDDKDLNNYSLGQYIKNENRRKY